MHVALVTTFQANKKEPLATLLSRIHTAFLEAGLGEPRIEFSFADAPTPGFVSSVDRVLKRHPGFQRFLSTDSSLPGVMPPVRRISNAITSPAAGEAIDFPALLTIAAGIPKSFPFHAVSLHFQSAAFGVALPVAGLTAAMAPGILVGDSWWVSGRMRSVMGMASVEPAASSKSLPPLPPAVATVYAACGKAKNTTQMPLAESQTPAATPRPAAPAPEIAQAVSAVVLDYRKRLGEVIDRAALPHDLPPTLEAMKVTPLGETTGPKKPVLVRAFKPMGYDCRGESGTFTLRRRTPSNLTAEIELDVGTWSRSLTASFTVTGLGYSVILPLPVSKQAMGGGQYPIGDATRWQQIVDNLAALVAEYDRSFVPAIEAAAGPSPEWYRPEA
jgi:hypothetical protein